MFEACTANFAQCDAAIMAAAVADYRPATIADQKIKKADNNLTITLEATPDIAKSLGQKKSPRQVLVGFALETENGLQNAEDKLKKKNLDFVVLNNANEASAGFNCDTNHVTIITSGGEKIEFPTKSKSEVANDIVNQLINCLNK